MSTQSTAKDKRAFISTLKSARIGFVEAQYEVGLMFANGVGVAQNLEQAVFWVRKAAERGLAVAQYLLGTRYAGGIAVEKDAHQALGWFLKASEQGHPKAFNKLARFYSAAHPDAAALCFLKSAELGVAEAQLALGQACALGEGVEQSFEQSHVWFQRAAQQGVAAAQFALAELYANGQGVPPDFEEAMFWYRHAAGQYHAAAQVAIEKLAAAGHARPTARGRRKSAELERRRDRGGWDKAAEYADADAKYHLGLMYQNGYRVPQDVHKAKDWFENAAKQEDARAQLALAKLLEEGHDRSALVWYQRAAEQGNRDAQRALGRLFLSADNADKDCFTGVGWYFKAGEQGDSSALLSLGHILSDSLEDLALSSFRQAAEQGMAQAQYLLAQRYTSGAGLQKNLFRAFDWYQKAAEQGYAPAQGAMGVCFMSGAGVSVDLERAISWFRLAADQNDPQAQWNLGSIYVGGGAGVKKDLRKAFLWCQKAAELAFAPAQSTLGVLFARIKNFENAVHWWTLAAEQGDPEGQYNLALMYSKGKGIRQDWQLAFRWFLAAAEQGVVAAQGRLGLMYATGDAVAKDPIEAHKWLVIAANAGDETATANCTFSQDQLGLMQIAEAQRRATEWINRQDAK
jgi:TPR repeat protein